MQSKLIIILLITSGVFGLTYNQNGDCSVNFTDFAMLAADYNDTVDLNDISGMSGEWLDYETSDPNRTPQVEDQTGFVFNDRSYNYTITATDGDSLTYWIIDITEPNAGDVNGTTTYPYQLPSNTFQFDPNSNYEGSFVIVYGADDGTGLTSPCGGMGIGHLSVSQSNKPTPPVANDSSTGILQYVPTNITIRAQDDGEPNVPGKLRYIITDLPDDPNSYLQDPASGAGRITSVPYTLSTHGNVVRYYADVNGMDSFSWKANDYGTDANSGDSNVVTVDVNVFPNPKDCLYFDGTGGTIEFPDSNYFDLITVIEESPWGTEYSGMGIDFWVKTSRPFQGICKKREASGKGWQLDMVSGKLRFQLYNDSNELIIECADDIRIDNGKWSEAGFFFNHDLNGIQITLNSALGYDVGVAVYGGSATGEWVASGTPNPFVFTDFNDPNVSYANDANLVFGLTDYGNYKGCIDKLRTFTGIADPMGLTAITQGLSGRTEDADEVILGFGITSTVLYMFDDAGGETLADVRPGIDDGIINDPNKVRWQPSLEYISDSSNRMLFNKQERKKWPNGF